MSLKNDLIFPFGNPYKEQLESHHVKTSLLNVVKLARDKIRTIKGEPEHIIVHPDGSECMTGERSIRIVEQLIQYIEDHEEED